MPGTFFIGFFEFWARTQGPHDSLLPGGPMSCQATPVSKWMTELLCM
ncbi:unnamed protein product [Staurois parvus]|uniref:Uncharacterized protein n=1 Tax=Staurois parvus TaxID=386267 RepID=A0ABN9BK91_9NEOB|nr:unnamed protein product [Staurois parvus]